MIKKLMLGMAVLAATIGATPAAQAWTKIKNNTPNQIFVSYGVISIGGVGCGYWTCRRGNSNGHRFRGWWGIAPGGTATVNGEAHHNATAHYVWGEDSLGHFWGGGGLVSGIMRPNAFDYCRNDPTLANWWGPAGSVAVDFFRINPPGSSCCGFWCSPVNFTQGLTL
jgi:hypothetical protein